MIEAIKNWYHRYLGRPEAGQLFLFLILIIAIILGFYKILLPVFISIIVAYLLEQIVQVLEHYKLPRNWAVLIVFLLFATGMLLLLIVVLPSLIKQLSNFLRDLPAFASQAQDNLQVWLHKFGFISDVRISSIIETIRNQLYESIRNILGSFVMLISSLLTAIVYFILVPLLVYLFLMGKKEIFTWSKRFMPKRNAVVGKVGSEMYIQIGNYVRRKVLEAIILGVMMWIAFFILGLEYATLLALLVGITVFIPIIGTIVVTIPIVIIGLLQWGLSPTFAYLMISYLIIMLFDGTILTAWLFSGAVSLHPLAIIIAILVFGGLFGVWGVLFAIPLASLVNALITHWPIQEPASESNLQE